MCGLFLGAGTTFFPFSRAWLPQARAQAPGLPASGKEDLSSANASAGLPAEPGQLEEILTRSLTALGGEERIAALAANYCVFGKEYDDVGTLEQVNRLDSQAAGGSSSYRLQRKGAKWRFDHERASGALDDSGVNNWTEGFNGESAWVQASGKTDDAVMDNAKLLNLESTLPSSFLLEAARSLSAQSASAGDLKVSLSGKTNFHDSPCYQIVFSSALAGESFTLYVEEKNYTVLGLRFKLNGVIAGAPADAGINLARDKAKDVEILYLEYRPVAGSALSLQRSAYGPGQGRTRLCGQ